MNIKVNIKFLITLASIIIMLFLLGTFSLATEEYSVFVSLTSNSSLKENEIVNVNVNLSNINAGNGIDVIVAKLNYDKNIFETPKSSDFNSNTGWHISYEPRTDMLTAIRDNKVIQNQTVFTLGLKARSTVNVDSTTISLQNIVVSGGRIIDGGTGDIYVNNTSINIKKPIPAPSTNYSVSMSLTHSTPFKEGQIITVNANLVNVNAGNGIDVIVAKLVYNTNLFEPITASSFSSNTGWRVSYALSTNMLTAIKDSKVKQSETAFSINLKVKSVIDISSTQLSLQDITVSGGAKFDGGTDDIHVNNASLTLNKVSEVISNNSSNTNSSNSVADTSNNVSTNVKYENNFKVLGTVATVDVPTVDSDVDDSMVLDTDVDANTINDEIVVPEIVDVNDDKDVKVSNSAMKVSNQVSETEDDNSEMVERVIVGSASSISFVSLAYVLFRKLLCGI